MPLYCFARLCSVFFPNSGSFVNKKRHSKPLFFFLPLFFFFICLVLADDAPSLAVYVPWLSLFTSLPPSVASWYHVAAVGTVFFLLLFVSFFFRPVVGVVRTRPWRTSTAVLSFHRARLLLGLLPCQDAAGCTSSVCTAGEAPGEHTDRVKKRGIWSELPKCFVFFPH